MVLAMVHHRAGKTAEAEQWLRKATATIDAARPEQANQPADVAVPDWIGLEVLRREAEDLIHLGKPEDAEKILEAATAESLEILATDPRRKDPGWNAWWNPMALSGTPAIRSTERYNRLAVLAPDDRALRIARPHYLANLQSWDESGAVMRIVVDLDPNDAWGWFNAAALALFRNDDNYYHHCCQEMVRGFADSGDSVLRDLTAKTCLLSSDNNPHRVMAIKLADESLTHGANPNDLRWLQLTKALADYGAEQFESAIAQAQASISGAGYFQGRNCSFDSSHGRTSTRGVEGAKTI